MAAETKKDESGIRRKLYRLNVQQFLRSIEAGVFPQGPRMELLRGIPVAQLIKTDLHDSTVAAFGDALRRTVSGEWSVREEKSLELGRYSRVVPDLAISRGPRAVHARRAPTERETALIVEVSDTSYRLDRGRKWRIYASAGVAWYGIANLAERRVEVYRAPEGRGRSASYREAVNLGPDDDVPVVFDGREVGRLAVRDILP